MLHSKQIVRYSAVLVISIFISSSAQKTYVVDDFSEDYFGKVYAEDTSRVCKQGWVAIYCKKTGKELIKVDGDQICFDLHDNQIKSNIAEIPYGEYSPILYQDFNFDKIKDIAIQNARLSCYGVPSFCYLKL